MSSLSLGRFLVPVSGKMAPLLGNFSFQACSKLQSHQLFFPLLLQAKKICCCRAYGTNGPVRYIPDKYSHREQPSKMEISHHEEEIFKTKNSHYEDEMSNHMRASKEISEDHPSNSTFLNHMASQDKEAMHKGSNGVENPITTDKATNVEMRYQAQFLTPKSVLYSKTNANEDGAQDKIFKLEVDDTFGDGDDDLNVMEDLEDELPSDEFQVPNNDKLGESETTSVTTDLQDARNVAIEVLALRSHTIAELTKKLRGKKIPLKLINSVIADFAERGLLNDYSYAETFSRSRWLSMSWGPRRIRQTLLQKGVSRIVADKAINHVFNGDSEEKDLCQGISKYSLDHLLASTSKQWLKGNSVPLETRKMRIVRWLQYRGFDWGVTNFILKQLESKYPS
ncbi:uncharacterized protein LOC18447535 isoform X1 [Amborella trichopoda]|nr:uncharacterized protein LOC18447535 isoform X1 [Amborella trichopoda]XP_020531270.1 uncharacterized protein LOC18447535 isoform X1 [Amborella trichopoda]|eukprot:XP_006857694.2 uncharacterized protein LOC18447535 isoform X1 [Amborella trichopoda]